MDYTVMKRDVFTYPDVAPWSVRPKIKIPNRKALLRSDTNGVLSIVSDNYKVVQPREVMYFFEDMITRLGFEMHTAGVLADGNRVWALAKIGKDFTLNGVDQVGGYLLFATSYDGKFSTTAQFTSIRVVCHNTLSWSLGVGEQQATGIVRIPHSAEYCPEEVKQQLGLMGDTGWVSFKDNVTKLADFKVTKRQAIEFFLELLGVDEEKASGRQLQSTKKLISFYESGPGSEFITSKNTTWGLVNAVTYFTDHGRRAQNNGTRFNSASFGAGAQLKEKAFSKALALADAA
jgi:phage/plasmid-like protein (TIGR03299 family)